MTERPFDQGAKHKGKYVVIVLDEDTETLKIAHSSLPAWALAGVGAWLCEEADRRLAREARDQQAE